MSANNTTAGDPPAPEFSVLCAAAIAALEELKAVDIRQIDVRDRTSITDLIVIASGTSSRHVKAIAEEVVRRTKAVGAVPLGIEGERDAEWVLVDLGDLIVHVMLPRMREFYGLERLWSVAEEVRQGGQDAS